MGIIDYKPYPSNVSLLEDTHIIASALKKDQFFSHTKSEIAIFFKKNRDSESRINFLKSTYNNEFTQFTDDNGTVYGYKTYLAGLQIWQGNFMTKTCAHRRKHQVPGDVRGFGIGSGSC